MKGTADVEQGESSKKKLFPKVGKPEVKNVFKIPNLRPVPRKIDHTAKRYSPDNATKKFTPKHSPIQENDEEEENDDYYENIPPPPKGKVGQKRFKPEVRNVFKIPKRKIALDQGARRFSPIQENENEEENYETEYEQSKENPLKPRNLVQTKSRINLSPTAHVKKKLKEEEKPHGMKSFTGQVVDQAVTDGSAPSPVSWIDPDEDSAHLLSETDYQSNEGYGEMPLPASPPTALKQKTSHQKNSDPKLSRSKLSELSGNMAGSYKLNMKNSRHYSVLMDEEWDADERKSDSVVFPVLLDIERTFHEIVASGDVQDVKRFLVDNPHLNINCVNYEKVSAIHVALREQNIEMVSFLLGLPEVDVCDVVLCAVKIGDLNLLTTVLGHLEDMHPGLEFAPCPFSVEFGDDLTPLILAAQEGKFEIVDLLIQRGHRMPDLHHPFCTCQECSASVKKYDHLKYSTIKMNQYRAVSSPSYLFQTSSDPILRSFELTNQLQEAKKMFPQFRTEYEELKCEIRNFSAELIGCCRNAQEVVTVLKQQQGCKGGTHLIYPRLQLAVDCLQKEFVAHPNVQAVLVNDWTGGDKSWKKQSELLKILATSRRLVELPFVLLVSCFLPRFLASYNRPVHRFISAMAMYIVFLILILILSSQDKKNQQRGPPPTGIIWPIMIYVFGYVVCSLQVCFTLGYQRFFSIGWNCYDFVMNIFFLLTFVFWWAAYDDVTTRGFKDLPRRAWESYDPTLIAEGLFVIATIMAYCKLYQPLSLNFYLGPLMIAIGKMTTDIFQYIFIFVLLIVAWTVGLSHFYQAYEDMIQADPTTKANTTQVSSFVNYPMTLKTLFWAIFGMSSIESADVIIENLEGANPNETIINRHKFTEGVGYFAFAMYQFLAVVVMMNMLVACMSNTFTKVVDNVPIEWVFGRTKIYLMYMYHSYIPPPFNLIPTMYSINRILQWCSLMTKSDPHRKATCTVANCCFIETFPDASFQQDFSELMSQLAQRYIRMKKEAAES